MEKKKNWALAGPAPHRVSLLCYQIIFKLS